MIYKLNKKLCSALSAIAVLLAFTASANDDTRPSPAQSSGVRADFNDAMSKPLEKPEIEAVEGDEAKKDDEAPEQELAVVEDLPKVYISEVVLEGNDLFSTEDLQALFVDKLDREMTFEEIKALSLTVKSYYMRKGYPIVKVFIPKGALDGSVLTLQVLEGKLGNVEVEGSKRFSESRAMKTIYSFLDKGEAFKIREAERPLVLLNSLAGISAKSTLKAGAEFGETDIVVKIEDKPLISGSIEFNNFGSENSGEYRILPYMSIRNATGWGDNFSAFGVFSPDMIDSWSYQVAYSLPVTTFGTSLVAYFGQGNNSVGGDWEILDIEGTSMSWGVGLTHSFIFSAKSKLTLELMFDWQDLDQDMLSVTTYEDKTRKIRVGAKFENSDSMGRTFISAYAHQGLGNCLGAMDNGSDMSSRDYAGADNRFTKFELGLMRLQSILPRVYGIFNVSAQYSLDPLVATEQIYMGGANSVRGQPYSSFAGDDGVIVNAELRYVLFDKSPVLHFAAFADYGATRYKTPITGQDEWNTAAGAGVGLRATLFDSLDLRFDVAVPVGHQYGDDYYLYGQVRYAF